MNISKGHSGLLKIFLLNLVKFHLVLGFQQSPFQISLEFKHDGMMNKQVKQGLNWGCDNIVLGASCHLGVLAVSRGVEL